MNQASKQSIVLVTGASSGIGLSCARLLAEHGYRVYGTSRGSRAGTTPLPASIEMLTMDVTSSESVEAAIATVLAKEGRLDIVINNAGIGIAGAVEETTIEEAKSLFETNFFGIHRVCRAVIPQLRKQGSGHIVNIGSMGAVVAIPFQVFYSASKAAIAMLSDGLSMELKPFGIKVTRIEPGDYKTAFTNNRVFVASANTSAVYKDACHRAIAVMEHDEQNGADPEELARTLLKIIRMPSPGLNYRLGMLSQRLLVGLIPFLPAKAVEKLVMKSYNI
jgi:NAD(P)-dependent dehydrogenase (short-subunit alcohol dehydrogenase family)